MASVQLSDGTILHNVHEEWQCGGRHCVIHNPSLHHMRNWALAWYNPHQLFLRQCPHGQMHPDPDVADYTRQTGEDWKLDHLCDGCCNDTITIDGEVIVGELEQG